MAPSKHYSEGGQLQLMDSERIEEEEECFESIDKRTPSASSPSLPPPVSYPALHCLARLLVCVRVCSRVFARASGSARSASPFN
jgi:hypothetical protein